MKLPLVDEIKELEIELQRAWREERRPSNAVIEQELNSIEMVRLSEILQQYTSESEIRSHKDTMEKGDILIYGKEKTKRYYIQFYAYEFLDDCQSYLEYNSCISASGPAISFLSYLLDFRGQRFTRDCFYADHQIKFLFNVLKFVSRYGEYVDLGIYMDPRRKMPFSDVAASIIQLWEKNCRCVTQSVCNESTKKGRGRGK